MAPLNLLVGSTGIQFLDDDALSGDCSTIPCGVTNCRLASMAFRVAAIRCPAPVCWQIVRRGQTMHLAIDTATSDIRAVEFAPQIATVTTPCCRTC